MGSRDRIKDSQKSVSRDRESGAMYKSSSNSNANSNLLKNSDSYFQKNLENFFSSLEDKEKRNVNFNEPLLISKHGIKPAESLEKVTNLKETMFSVFKETKKILEIDVIYNGSVYSPANQI
jgi:hypothetical protein